MRSARAEVGGRGRTVAPDAHRHLGAEAWHRGRTVVPDAHRHLGAADAHQPASRASHLEWSGWRERRRDAPSLGGICSAMAAQSRSRDAARYQVSADGQSWSAGACRIPVAVVSKTLCAAADPRPTSIRRQRCARLGALGAVEGYGRFFRASHLQATSAHTYLSRIARSASTALRRRWVTQHRRIDRCIHVCDRRCGGCGHGRRRPRR